MDFLRQHLPGLHQALRGALDSLSTFVSYLIGDEVPTVVREEQTAQVLEEVASGKPEKILEEEAWEVVEGLRGSQSEGVGGLGGSGRVGTCREGSSAEQTWGWRAGTSCGSQAEKQETGAWEAVKGQEPNDPLEVGKESEAVPKTQPDRSSGAPENSKEVSEKEVSREETPRTWEQKEEEEDGWVTEQGMARGVESQLTWQGKPEQSVDADGPKVADGQRDEQVEEEAATETKGLGMKETTREEMGVMVVWSGESSSVLESTQGPGTDSEDWIASSNEEARIAPGREEMDFSEVQEAESRLVSGQRSPEVTGRVWVLEEAPKRDQEEEVDERGNVERNILLKQTQALGPKGTEEAADGLTTERKTAGQKPEEAGEVSEGEDDLCGKETDGRPDIAISVEEASLEEVVQVEETQREEGHYQDSDANLVLYNEAVDKADVEAIPEATSEEECIEERNEEAHKSLKALEVKVTENQEPEPMGGTQTPVGQPEEAQRGEDELERDPILSEEWVERRLEAYPQHPGPADPELPEAETWENRSKKGTESRNVQEEKDAEGEEEEAASQALKAEAEGKPLSELLEIQTYGTEKGQASIIENQVLEERKGDEAEPGQSLTESEARKSKADEVEATMPGGADNGGCRLEKVILSLQDSQDPGTSSWDAEVMEDEAGEGPVKEADVSWEKAFERGWESKGQEKVIEGEKQCEQEIGTVDSAEEPTGQSSHPEAGEAKEKEQAEAGESTMAEGTEEMGDTGSGSQEARAEETEALVQAEELLEEAGGGQVREPREGSEGQCGDHHPEGEAQKLPGMEDHVTEDLTLEAQETEPEALENAQEQEGQLPPQVSAGAVPVPSETMEAVESTRGDPGNGWSEALLPGSLLDVSVPRSRVLLSRSSSQRRSRPSFRRSLVTEQQDDIPCAQPQPGPSSPEPRPLQLEEAPEPSPPKPEGTPVPARRRPVGGFGIVHPGMMQELQARLARPKPQ
ncbi:apolipoprotein B receptor [Perognathus longimembris pacificus]|uniref:apolipoprotein B receptor n=1 Tax=Perognathus longimembris pacificus TaxID=214514 RepID=UPI002019F25D|nr:apolipoprotein B receptor [Perognathus longimembris pacificus]